MTKRNSFDNSRRDRKIYRHLTVWGLNVDERRRLDRLAKLRGVSSGEIVRRLIRRELAAAKEIG